MGKTNQQRCVLTLELFPEKWQIDIIEKRFKIMEHLKNSLIAKELRKLRNIERTKIYRQLLQNIKEADEKERKKLYKERNQMLKSVGFSEYAFIDDITPMQKHFVEHFSAQIVHKSASDVWRAFEKVLFNNGRAIHFIPKDSLDSIACKKMVKE